LCPVGAKISGRKTNIDYTDYPKIFGKLHESHGGKSSSSVSSKTTFVLVGESPGSKLAKAQKLGVRIVNEQEFLEMIGMD